VSRRCATGVRELTYNLFMQPKAASPGHGYGGTKNNPRIRALAERVVVMGRSFDSEAVHFPALARQLTFLDG
jgi:hypothetical protein